MEKNKFDYESVEDVPPVTEILHPERRKLFVVGDSTVSPFNDKRFFPRFGYGTKLQDFLDGEKIEVENLAMSGRSSVSFTREPNYATLLRFIKAGDWLLIAFGHNDEKSDPDRYSNAGGGIDEEGSFKHSLFYSYIKPCRERGAVAVLATPIVRRSPESVYEGAVVHVTADQPGYPGGDYPAAIRSLAAETGTLLVDHTLRTKDFYGKEEAEATLPLHSWRTADPASVDNTHLSERGARQVAGLVVADLAAISPEFQGFLNAPIKS